MIERQFVAALEVLKCYQFFITSVNSPLMWNFRKHQNLTVDIQWHKKRLIDS